jgi:glycosyltransferase involved in cell wall biosynthesis
VNHDLDCRVAMDVSTMYETFVGGVGYATAHISRELSRLLGQENVRFFSPLGSFSEPPRRGPFSGTNGSSPLKRSRVYRLFHREFILPGQVRRFGAHVVHFPDAKVPRSLSSHDMSITVTVNDVGPFVGESPAEDAPRHRNTIIRGTETADLIIAISGFTKISLIDVLGIEPEKITTAYLGVSERYRPFRKDIVRQWLRNRFGIGPGYFLSLGEMNQRKNILSLIRGHQMLPVSLRKRHPLVLAGRIDRSAGGSRGAYIEETLGNVDDHVLLTGLVTEDEKIRLYNGSIAFVFPSRYEGFGLPVLEAMACGKAVAAGNNSALSELHTGKALLLDDTSPSQLAGAMTSLIDDEPLRRELEETGREHAAGFTWERTARETLNAFREAIRRAEAGR